MMQAERSTTLPIDIEAVAPSEHALIDFFSQALSVDAAIEHWRLVLWCPRRPVALQGILRSGPSQQEADQVLAVFGWKHNRRARWTSVPVAEVLRHPELIESGQRVVLARRELPPEVFHLLRQRLGYEPDIAGQVLGWWYGEDDELPEEPPPWRHTGSILPEGAGDLRDGMHCLVLVDVDDCWFVLSERALRTYAFSIRLADGEPLRFVRSTEARLQIWTATPVARISFAEVEERFGPAVAQRTRRDAATVLVRVHRAAGV